MKTKYFILAAAAAIFAACSSDDGLAPEQQPNVQTGQVPVAFDSYVNRGTTRAGQSGEMNLDNLKTATAGFGVFAYYTNNEAYDQIFTPNFMYNQGVIWDDTNSKWGYTPIKYWPNEYSDAQADENDKISFFAYAPYVKSTTTGKPIDTDGTTPLDATKGIAGFSRNTATGDPLVKYIATGNIADQVDLLWGVCPETGSGKFEWPLHTTSGATVTQTLEVGKPLLNIQHPKNMTTGTGAQLLKFNFLHALAGLQVTVQTSADVTTTANTADPEAKTKVFIRSIKFTGMTTKGSLNLNNTIAAKAVWLDFAGINDMESGQSITWFDGRKDGAEGTTTASNEKIKFLNPALIQTGVWEIPSGTDPDPGVNGTKQYLFSKITDATTTPVTIGAATASDYVYVIPTGDDVICTIEYDVLTEDDMLPGFLNDNKTHGSVVKNVITKEIKLSDATTMKLENGKKYTINLYLGLKSVTFDAAVAGWETGSTGSGELPANP